VKKAKLERVEEKDAMDLIEEAEGRKEEKKAGLVFREVQGDLFTSADSLVHCLSEGLCDC
jgi:hypothetical protein